MKPPKLIRANGNLQKKGFLHPQWIFFFSPLIRNPPRPSFSGNARTGELGPSWSAMPAAVSAQILVLKPNPKPQRSIIALNVLIWALNLMINFLSPSEHKPSFVQQTLVVRQQSPALPYALRVLLWLPGKMGKKRMSDFPPV